MLVMGRVGAGGSPGGCEGALCRRKSSPDQERGGLETEPGPAPRPGCGGAAGCGDPGERSGLRELPEAASVRGGAGDPAVPHDGYDAGYHRQGGAWIFDGEMCVPGGTVCRHRGQALIFPARG